MHYLQKSKLVLAAGLLTVSSHALAQANSEAFFSVTSPDNQTQGMAMVLATQMLEQKVPVRMLLCGPAGQIALKAHESATLKPRNISPKDMLTGLVKAGATVEVCALFLPNAERTPADLVEGVHVAKPSEVAAYLQKANVRNLGF